MSSTLRRFNRKLDPRMRNAILLSTIVLVIIYYIDTVLRKGTVEQGIVDWGIDMGVTQLFFGMLLVGICLFFLVYPRQQIFRNITLTRTHAVVFGSVILFVVLGASIFSWLAHDPTINFFHSPFWDVIPIPVDKLSHLFWSFVITLVVLAVQPKKLLAVILWCAFALYELFEVVVIYNFGETEFDMDVANVFASEMADIPLDLIMNTLGWLLAIAVLVLLFKRRLK